MNKLNLSSLTAALILAIVSTLLLLSLPAQAQAANTATLSWTPATTHADGSPLVGTPFFNVYQGASGKEAKVQNGVALTSVLLSSLPNGTTCWYVTQVEVATGLESAPSAEVCKTFVTLPNPPTGVTVK